MTIDVVMDKLRTFIRSEFKVPASDAEFTDDVHLFDYGYVDSFGAVTLIAFIDERFSVKISDQDLIVHPLNTIREISTLVAERVKEEI
jgi:D-alanine--poly(phosphoribitol) ligase subunit 2